MSDIKPWMSTHEGRETHIDKVISRARELGRISREVYRSEYGKIPAKVRPEMLGSLPEMLWDSDWKCLVIEGAIGIDRVNCMLSWIDEFKYDESDPDRKRWTKRDTDSRV